jgi:hypothetical protein
MRCAGRYVTLLFAALSLARVCPAFVQEHEPNDLWAQANAVVCGDTVVCGTLPGNDTDAFRFGVMAGDSIVLTTFACDGSHTNTLLALCDPDDSLLTVNDYGGQEAFAGVHWRASESGDYTVYVYRHPATPDCTYSLLVNCPHFVPEAYDLCTTPRLVPGFPYFEENGTTRGMTSQCGNASPDVFYRFQNPATATLRVQVCTNQFDARVQLVQGCCTDYLDDASTGCGLGATLVTYNLPPGEYNVLVEGTTAAAAGPFSLEITAELPPCPAPGPVVLATIGGYPFLDWPELDGPSYYVVWQSPSVDGIWEHVGTTFFTYFVDSTGYTASRRFYHVTAVCPW